jgi:hypothetical protein
MQKRKRDIIDFSDRIDRLEYFMLAAHTGRENERLSKFSELGQVEVVGEFRRANLQRNSALSISSGVLKKSIPLL